MNRLEKLQSIKSQIEGLIKEEQTTSFNFKRGDYVTIQTKDRRWLIIASGKVENISNINRYLRIFDLVHYNNSSNYIYIAIEDNTFYVPFDKNEIPNIRLSTPEEREQLNTVMRNEGYYFNDITLNIEKIPESIPFDKLIDKKVYKMFSKRHPELKILFIFSKIDGSKIMDYLDWFEFGDCFYPSLKGDGYLIDTSGVLYIQEASIEEATFLYSKLNEELQ